MNHLPKVLVIDDEASIRRLLKLTFEGVPYHVVEARDAREGLHLAAAERPDLLVLDMGLPDRRGIEVLKDLRSWSTIPVVIVSVENETETIIAALDAGADDYITKPFRSDELLARVRVCLRRNLASTAPTPIIQLKNVSVDLEKRLVSKDNVAIKLTATEYDLLVYLIKNRGKVVTHGQILKSVWGPTAADDASYPRVYVRHLRQKLEDNPDEPSLIITELGVGYRLSET